MSASTCEWVQQDPGTDMNLWDTECGELMLINEDGPRENKFKYCCFCGGFIIPIYFEYEEDEDE